MSNKNADEARGYINRLEEEIEGIRDALREQDDRIASLNSEIEDLKATIVELKDQLQELGAINKEVEGENEKLKSNYHLY